MPCPSWLLPSAAVPSLLIRCRAVAAVLACLLIAADGIAAAPAQIGGVPAAAVSAAPAPVVTGRWEVAISAYQSPLYPPDFSHFAHVNPQAPKGGTLRLRNPDRRTSFDKYNPFTTKGVAPAALEIFMFESLAAQSLDEPQAMYGLLAEQMMVAPDLSSISFRLRPGARFNNGDPLTPEDVVHSFRQLSGKQAAPYIAADYSAIADVVVVDARTVRFELREHKLDVLFKAGTMPVFSRKWGGGRKFDEIVTDMPITTGAYRIAKAEMPSRIEFSRRADYWAAGLPVRRGYFNFDRVEYRMYKDDTVSREAFKAGEFDLLKEYTARAWARQHQGAKWRDGRIVKHAFPIATGRGLQSIQFNLRRPLFQDIRVREALVLAWDFENYNRYGTFRRANSLFNNSVFAAAGPPSPAELALLEPFRAELPPRVFGPAFVGPSTAGSVNGLRDNLKRARDLLAQAGWKVADDGRLRNAQGTAFEFQYLEPSRLGANVMWQRNLEKLGIQLNERLVDYALYRRRLEAFDFDSTGIAGRPFTLPPVAELQRQFKSSAADEEGSDNLRGIKNPAVDRLLDALGRANTLDELTAAAHALDRVILWNFYQLPALYLGTEQVSYWNKFGIPATPARYFSADTISNLYAQPWPLWTWWDKSLSPATSPPRAQH